MNAIETPAEPIDSLVAEIIFDSLVRRGPSAWCDEQRLDDWLGRVMRGEGDAG